MGIARCYGIPTGHEKPRCKGEIHLWNFRELRLVLVPMVREPVCIWVDWLESSTDGWWLRIWDWRIFRTQATSYSWPLFGKKEGNKYIYICILHIYIYIYTFWYWYIYNYLYIYISPLYIYILYPLQPSWPKQKKKCWIWVACQIDRKSCNKICFASRASGSPCCVYVVMVRSK